MDNENGDVHQRSSDDPNKMHSDRLPQSDALCGPFPARTRTADRERMQLLPKPCQAGPGDHLLNAHTLCAAKRPQTGALDGVTGRGGQWGHLGQRDRVGVAGAYTRWGHSSRCCGWRWCPALMRSRGGGTLLDKNCGLNSKGHRRWGGIGAGGNWV